MSNIKIKVDYSDIETFKFVARPVRITNDNTFLHNLDINMQIMRQKPIFMTEVTEADRFLRKKLTEKS